MFRKKKAIPPPLAPPEKPSFELMVPFYLVEQTRVMLDYLTRAEGIPEAHRHMIDEWLSGYSGVLAWYIIQIYGFPGLLIASEEAQDVYNRFYEAVGSAYKESESSLLEFLEKDLWDDGTADSV